LAIDKTGHYIMLVFDVTDGQIEWTGIVVEKGFNSSPHILLRCNSSKTRGFIASCGFLQRKSRI